MQTPLFSVKPLADNVLIYFIQTFEQEITLFFFYK